MASECHHISRLGLDRSVDAEEEELRAGYRGWLLYTAASAGDMGFVQELLDRDPLLVFSEGEYRVTAMFYAATRGGDTEVFRMLLDHAMSPRCSTNCRDGEGANGRKFRFTPGSSSCMLIF